MFLSSCDPFPPPIRLTPCKTVKLVRPLRDLVAAVREDIDQSSPLSSNGGRTVLLFATDAERYINVLNAVERVGLAFIKLGVPKTDPFARHFEPVGAIQRAVETLLQIVLHFGGSRRLLGIGDAICKGSAGDGWSQELRQLSAILETLTAWIDAKRRPAERPDCPTFKIATGQLLYRGKLCKQLKKQAPDQEKLFQSFEELGWPVVMDEPIGKAKLVDTVHNANKNLRLIIFGVRGGGGKVCWRRRQ